MQALRQGMHTSCLNYGKPEKGYRANGFTTDGGFAEYAINHINTLAHVPGTMSDAEGTLVVTAGTSMYGPDRAGRAGGQRKPWSTGTRSPSQTCDSAALGTRTDR